MVGATGSNPVPPTISFPKILFHFTFMVRAGASDCTVCCKYSGNAVELSDNDQPDVLVHGQPTCP